MYIRQVVAVYTGRYAQSSALIRWERGIVVVLWCDCAGWTVYFLVHINFFFNQDSKCDPMDRNFEGNIKNTIRFLEAIKGR